MDAKILKPDEVRHQIKNGDVLLYKGTTFGSRIIQKVKLPAHSAGLSEHGPVTSESRTISPGCRGS